MNVKATLLCLEAVLGLMISFFKSEQLGIRVEDAFLANLVDIMGCEVVTS